MEFLGGFVFALLLGFIAYKVLRKKYDIVEK